MEHGPKRRTSVNLVSTSANRRDRRCTATRGNRASRSRGSTSARPVGRTKADCRPNGLARTWQEAREWETVQELFLTSRSRFVGLAYSVLRNTEDAEDAVQDALVSAFRHLRGFEGRSALTTWFTRIVLNAALMIWRKRKPGRIESLPEASTTDEISWTERIPDSHPDPEMVFAEKETFQWIDVLLGKMSPLLRQAFTLTYYEEMPNEEAGALLGVTTGTFKSRVFRARQDLMNQAKRAFVAPIRHAVHVPFSSREVEFPSFGAMAMAAEDGSLMPVHVR
jgi:RNA polymerase sigma-70 factor (ECF subfamily)